MLKTYRLAAIVKSRRDTVRDRPILVQETAIHQSPEIEDAALDLGVSTLVRGHPIIPLVSERLVARVEAGVRSQRRRGSVDERSGVVDAERVPVSWHREHDLGGGHARGRPRLDRRHGGALLVCRRRARVVQRRVWAHAGAPRTPHVVVHDFDEVELFRKGGHVGEWGAIRSSERSQRYGGGECQLLADFRLSQFLEEGEVVCGIVWRDGVTANSLPPGVLPAKWPRKLTREERELKDIPTYSKSIASKSYLLTRPSIAWMNCVRFCAEPTLDE